MESVSNRGLVDTIAAGFGTLNRRLFLLLLPIGLDGLLWLGPKLSITSLVSTLVPEGFSAAQASTTPVEVNLLGLLTFQLPSFIGFGIVRTASAAPVQAVTDWSQAVVWALVIGAMGILFACFYLGTLAAQVRGESPTPGAIAARAVLYWVQVVALLALVVAGIGVLTTAVAALSGGDAGLMLAMITVPLLMGAFYFFFVQDALFVSRVSSINALRYGLRVIRRSFWAALALFLVAQVIALGTGIIWVRLSGNAAGLAAAIVGNAYVTTGLVAAGMVFYYDRIRLIEQEEQVK